MKTSKTSKNVTPLEEFYSSLDSDAKQLFYDCPLAQAYFYVSLTFALSKAIATAYASIRRSKNEK